MPDPPAKKRKTAVKPPGLDEEDAAPTRRPRRTTARTAKASAPKPRSATAPSRKKSSTATRTASGSRKENAPKEDATLFSYFPDARNSQPIPDEEDDRISSDDDPTESQATITSSSSRVLAAIRQPTRKTTSLTVSKPASLRFKTGGGNVFKIRDSPKSKPPPTTRPAASQTVVSTPRGNHSPPAVKLIEDTRPWPERFAPRTSDELAVNKTRVSQVRTWIEAALKGVPGHRMLVLTGPAGTGKTATVEALCRELGVEVLEWKNPASAVEDDGESAFSRGLTGMFEEFLGRAGQFGALELVTPGTQRAPPTKEAGQRRKLILIEDFPNTLFTTSSAPLTSFRHTLRSFLALPPPPPGAPPLPPLVLILSETPLATGPDAFTAQKLLTPLLLHHPQTTSLAFNKIAPTFLRRALAGVCERAGLQAGKDLLDRVSTDGDIRAALLTLQFLSTHPSTLPALPTPAATGAKRKKPPPPKPLTAGDLSLLDALTRQSSYTLFHATGKILYNKRWGDDADDPFTPPPPRPTNPALPYHPRAIRPNLATLLDETGADPHTFVLALHENYPPSLNFLGGLRRRADRSDEELLLDAALGVLENLADADALLHAAGWRADDSALRGLEMAVQVACRGTMLALPSPVRRDRGAEKMFYPVAARLWRVAEEVEGCVDVLRAREGRWQGGRAELLERLAWRGVIEGAAEGSLLGRVVTFGGVGGGEEGVEEEEAVGRREVVEGTGAWKLKGVQVLEEQEKLVLSDDDIEDSDAETDYGDFEEDTLGELRILGV